MKHDFADGKYTVINNNGILTALRHGEPWERDLVGDNLVYWMLVEVDRLKTELAATKAVLGDASDPMQVAERFKTLIFPLREAWSTVHASTNEALKKEVSGLMRACGEFSQGFVPSDLFNDRLYAALEKVWPLVNTPMLSEGLKRQVKGALEAGKKPGEPVVIDLAIVAYESLVEAASQSKWIPPEYVANDWLADCRDFLINGHPTTA